MRDGRKNCGETEDRECLFLGPLFIIFTHEIGGKESVFRGEIQGLLEYSKPSQQPQGTATWLPSGVNLRGICNAQLYISLFI